MTDENIKEIFEKFFQKYKKTEGDRTVWSAPCRQFLPDGTFEINLTKCPRGDIFKIFVNNKKIFEISGWGNFLQKLPELEKNYPRLFSRYEFFEAMQEMSR